MTAKLTVGDIADLRAYERERDEFRSRIIDLKKRRRVSVGPVVTLVFENRDTVRFQIQEMARVEKLISDEAIQTELDIYNPLIPEPGRLCATLFIELTTDEELRTWLPKLVGVERSIELRLDGRLVVTSVPEEEHDKQLTRDAITAAVHYVRFELGPEEVAALRTGGAQLAVAHPNYAYATELPEPTLEELRNDVKGG